MDSIAHLKLIDAGVSKEDIMLLTTAMFVLKVIIPILVSKYTGGPKPLSLIMKCMLIRYKTNVPIK